MTLFAGIISGRSCSAPCVALDEADSDNSDDDDDDDVVVVPPLLQVKKSYTHFWGLVPGSGDLEFTESQNVNYLVSPTKLFVPRSKMEKGEYQPLFNGSSHHFSHKWVILWYVVSADFMAKSHWLSVNLPLLVHREFGFKSSTKTLQCFVSQWGL